MNLIRLFGNGVAPCLMLAGVSAMSAASLHAQSAIEFGAALTVDAAANLQGGAETASGWLANLDLSAAFDGGAIGWPGGSAFLYLLGNTGDTPSEWVGDYQGTNNIEAPEAFRLFEAWLEQSLAEGRVTVLAGLRDLNAEFYVMEHGELFIHSSMGIGVTFSQTGRNGPSIFPNSALAVRLQGELSGALRLRAGVWDAVANDPSDPSRTDIRVSDDEGALLVGEIELGPGADAWRLVLGGFRYTEPVTTPDMPGSDAGRSRDRGIYGILEGRLGRLGEADLYGFLHGGTATEDIHSMGGAWGAGLVGTGLFGRGEDRLGLALAATDGLPGFEVAELTWEAAYAWVATPWTTIRLDGQWVDFGDARDDALILTTRFGIAFER